MAGATTISHRRGILRDQAVRLHAGTTVLVWDFETGKSDTWLIDEETARHEFIAKSVLRRPTISGSGTYLVVVQPGFEGEYEIRVPASEVTTLGPAQGHPSGRSDTRHHRSARPSIAI